jgi:hypothetical protein
MLHPVPAPFAVHEVVGAPWEEGGMAGSCFSPPPPYRLLATRTGYGLSLSNSRMRLTPTRQTDEAYAYLSQVSGPASPPAADEVNTYPRSDIRMEASSLPVRMRSTPTREVC